MAKKKNLESKIQSEIDNTRDAKNSTHGFTVAVSSGTHGAGDSYRNQR